MNIPKATNFTSFVAIFPKIETRSMDNVNSTIWDKIIIESSFQSKKPLSDKQTDKSLLNLIAK